MDHDRMKSALLAFGLGAAFIVWTAAAFRIGLQAGKSAPLTAVNVRVDTLTVRDTLRVLEPVEYERVVTQFVEVPAWQTVTVHDTVFVQLPAERATYQGNDYRAVVSGIRPVLEEIQVFPKTVTITRTETVPGPQRWKRVGFGIAAGPGVFWDGSAVKPGAGIVAGVRVNL